MRHRKEENSSRAALQVIGVVILFANPPASLSCYMSYSPNAFRSENILGNNKYEGALQVAVQACGISGRNRGQGERKTCGLHTHLAYARSPGTKETNRYDGDSISNALQRRDTQ